MYVLKNKFYIVVIGLFDFFGYIFCLPLRLIRRGRVPKSIKNILIIRLDHIGDVVFSTPVPQNIKNHYPGSRITFLVSGLAKDIIQHNPYIDTVISYDAPWFRRNGGKKTDLRSFFKLAGELRTYRYDVGIDLRGDLRHIILMFLGGVKFRVGYGITGGGFLLHRKGRYKHNDHAIEHNLHLLQGIDIKPSICEPQLYTLAEDRSRAESIFKDNGLLSHNFIVAVHPHAGYASKDWPHEKFIELIRLLYREYAATILLIGSSMDRDKNRDIIEQSKVPALDLAGETSLGTLFELLKMVNIFVGVDSGPAHIAALTGKPTVVIYSGTNKQEAWAPRGNNVAVIQKDIPCRECGKTDCIQNLCMEMISVNEVMDRVRQVAKL